jgi:hypothetical protein
VRIFEAQVWILDRRFRIALQSPRSGPPPSFEVSGLLEVLNPKSKIAKRPARKAKSRAWIVDPGTAPRDARFTAFCCTVMRYAVFRSSLAQLSTPGSSRSRRVFERVEVIRLIPPIATTAATR